MILEINRYYSRIKRANAASLGQQIFDIAEAEAEAIVEPFGVADAQRREALTPAYCSNIPIWNIMGTH